MTSIVYFGSFTRQKMCRILHLEERNFHLEEIQGPDEIILKQKQLKLAYWENFRLQDEKNTWRWNFVMHLDFD